MKMRIATKLMLASALGVFALVSIVSITAYRIARNGLEEKIASHLESVAQSRAAHVRTLLREHRNMIELAATSRVLRIGLRRLQAADADQAALARDLNARLHDFADFDAHVYEVFLLNCHGKVVASTNPESIGLDRSANTYFVGAKEGPFIKDVYLSETTGRASMALSAPLDERSSHELLGVLVARLDTDNLNEVCEDRTGLGKTGETYLINEYGFMITPSRFLKDTFLRQKVDSENARRCLADMAAVRRGELAEAHEHEVMLSADYRGTPALSIHAHVPEMGWGLLAKIDAAEAFAPIARLRTALVWFAVLSGGAAVGLACALARRISRPIHELHLGSERIGNGELDYRVVVKSGDEIEQLANEFNRMAARLSESYSSLERKVAERTARLTAANGKLEEEIAQRKRAEEQLRRYAADLAERNEEVQRFTYVVSHDLRAPLVNLKGFAGELRTAMADVGAAMDSALPHLKAEEQKAVMAALRKDIPEALDFIGSSVSRMDDLINALLKLSRLGRSELTLEPVDMNALVQMTLKTLAHQIEACRATVSVQSLPQVIADKTAMEQIMGNLLNNAVLYLDPSRPGEISIEGERNGEETTFRVRDNGRGIAAEDMDKVFAPFRQAGRQDVPGEGMGLVYVRKLVHRHGGRIWCESELGVGTTFSFTISNHLRKGENHE